MKPISRWCNNPVSALSAHLYLGIRTDIWPYRPERCWQDDVPEVFGERHSLVVPHTMLTAAQAGKAIEGIPWFLQILHIEQEVVLMKRCQVVDMASDPRQ